MRKMKKLRVIRYILSIMLIVYGFYIVTVPWYFGNDDRYAVDNLQFVADKAKEAGIDFKIDTKGIKRLKYPTPIALLELVDVTTNWTNAYLAAVELNRCNRKDVDYSNYDSKTNPYNALSLLSYGAETEIVRLPYELIKYHTAITDPNTKLDSMILDRYIQDTEVLEEEMTLKYKEYYEYFKARVSIGLFFIVVAIVLIIRR